MATYLKSEPDSLQCSLEMLGAIDKKHGSFDIVFFWSCWKNISVNAVVVVENSWT